MIEREPPFIDSEVRSYRDLANVVAQLHAADNFCTVVHSHVTDEWEVMHEEEGTPAPDVEHVTSETVLAALQSIRCRFDVGPTGDCGEGYFTLAYRAGPHDRVLHVLALRLLERLKLPLDSLCQWFWDGLVVVPDSEHVVPDAIKWLKDCSEDDLLDEVDEEL